MTEIKNVSTDALTDLIILSKALSAQIERCEERIEKLYQLTACSYPILFDIGFTGILGEKVVLQSIPFDQLSFTLREMLRQELWQHLLDTTEAIRIKAARQLDEVRNQISILRKQGTEIDQ